MAFQLGLFIFIILTGALDKSKAARCDRKLDGTSTDPIQLNGRFSIIIWTFNRTDAVNEYLPNTRYIVSLEGDRIGHEHGPEKMSRFLLTLDNQNESSPITGTFDLIDDSVTQFSPVCPNSVIETSTIPKQEISVIWTSPPEGSGCILIRATVMETPETWYMDEGALVRLVCQDPKVDKDDPGPILPDCCACEEAKYEVTFEGLWSRNTHPKDFPTKSWLIKFSDVIGASHTVNYRFWEDNKLASEGLQQVAEYGSTRKLESELKEQSEHIRTIIKARGVSHPNVTGRTFAVFRVDRMHHLMSLVSMIVPSPDWIVGVSGLELCLVNCSWIEHKELNLYPVDVGTDDGITYMSPDSPSDPPQPIRRITSSWPNDTQSPFYNPLGIDMKPMARLHLNRQRLYEKSCDNMSTTPVNSGGDFNPEDNNVHKQRPKNKACRTTHWSAWGPCSVSCGRGTRLRQRNFKDKTAAAMNNCNTSLTDRGKCEENSPDCNGKSSEGTILNTEACELNDWSEWSSCTTSCGEGSQTRSRNFIHRKHRKRCKAVPDGPELQQTVDCENSPCENPELERVRDDNDNEDENDEEENEIEEENEEGEEEEIEEDDDEGMIDDEFDDELEMKDMEVTEEWLQKCPSDLYSEWSLWSPCSSTCGPGTKTRSRSPVDSSSEGLWECRTQIVNCTAKILSCEITPEEAEEICIEPKEPGTCNMGIKRVYFNASTNQCRYFNYGGCDGNRNNFQTVEECSRVCLELRNVQELDAFNGIQSGNQIGSSIQSSFQGDEKIDCQFSDWSDWSPCFNCRGQTVQSRYIMVPAKNGGKKCPTKLMRKKKCHKLPSCFKGELARRRRYRDRKSIWNQNKQVDCQLTQWSPWSKCHATCGNTIQHRTRKVKIHPHGVAGKPCTRLVEFRKCSMLPCH